MDDIQLKAALVDLAEYGYVFVETKKDANQVAEAAPIKTETKYYRFYMVREALKDESQGSC